MASTTIPVIITTIARIAHRIAASQTSQLVCCPRSEMSLGIVICNEHHPGIGFATALFMLWCRFDKEVNWKFGHKGGSLPWGSCTQAVQRLVSSLSWWRAIGFLFESICKRAMIALLFAKENAMFAFCKPVSFFPF